jgi:hypothetical protein
MNVSVVRPLVEAFYNTEDLSMSMHCFTTSKYLSIR